jgi:CheY-like chemotaxis protein
MLSLTLKNLHILVVDDDKDNRQLLDTFLSANGAKVTSCEDGEPAYQKTTVYGFSCIVSDIHMPFMSGVELLSKLRHLLRCDTPLILMSDYSEFTPSELTHKGAQGFLTKPFSLQTLKNMILDCVI